MSTPISQFIPPHPQHPPLLPGDRKFVLYICNFVSVSYIGSFVPFF